VLSLTGLAPSLKETIPVPQAALTITGFARTVLGGSLVQPDAGSLTLTGFAPTLAVTLAVPTQALTITGFQPVIALTGNLLLQPGTAILAMVGNAPALFIPAPAVSRR
jgi:hypothetical protein